jgi:chromate reductase
VELELYDGLKQIPPFDEDDEGSPAPEVWEWRDAIEVADAVLFATPEYNSSIPGQLKNAGLTGMAEQRHEPVRAAA